MRLECSFFFYLSLGTSKVFHNHAMCLEKEGGLKLEKALLK